MGLKIKVKDDVFIHFTPRKNLDSILKFDGLQKNPPGIQKRGIDAITAVSLKWGKYVPEVQTQGIKDRDIVAIIFKTLTKPKYGYVEEVVWGRDLKFNGKPKIVSFQQGINLLKKANTLKDEDEMVEYY